MEVKHTRQKTYYHYRAYCLKYSEREQVLLFPTVKNKETRKLACKGPYTIGELINKLNFRVCHDGTKKITKVLYKRFKKFTTGEQFFRPMENICRPQQQETTSSAGRMDDDIIELQVEKTIIPGHAKHTVAAEKINTGKNTPKNKKNEMTMVATVEDTSRSISPAFVKKM